MQLDISDPQQRAAIIAALNAQIVATVGVLQNIQRTVNAEQAAAQAAAQAAQPPLASVGAPQANNMVQLRPANGVAVNAPAGQGAVAVEVIDPAPAPNDPAVA